MKLFICLLLLFITVASYAQPDKEKMIGEITAMAKVAWCYDPTFSADGKEITFLSNMSGSPQVWKMSATGGWPVQLTGFADPVITQSWSPKGD